MVREATMQPFHSGTEHVDWIDANCCSGAGCRKYKPDASSSRDGCPMEVAMARATCGFNKGPRGNEITHAHALRCGLLIEGPNGTLVEPEIRERCPEYAGRDEPGPPRWPSRPPVDGAQLDMLDPRNDERQPVAAVSREDQEASGS